MTRAISPDLRAATLRISCPVCDAPPGQTCHERLRHGRYGACYHVGRMMAALRDVDRPRPRVERVELRCELCGRVGVQQFEHVHAGGRWMYRCAARGACRRRRQGL